MNNKAFTLVELLAIIVILAIIAIITTPNVINLINDSKDSLNKRQKEQILNAARMYGSKNVTYTNDQLSKTEITIKDLKDEGYLDDKDIKDLKNNTNLENCNIEISWENNQLTYSFEEKEGCPSNE